MQIYSKNLLIISLKNFLNKKDCMANRIFI